MYKNENMLLVVIIIRRLLEWKCIDSFNSWLIILIDFPDNLHLTMKINQTSVISWLISYCWASSDIHFYIREKQKHPKHLSCDFKLTSNGKHFNFEKLLLLLFC